MNFIRTGSEKIVATYIFTGQALMSEESSWGKLFLNQSYRGSSIKSVNSNFRDDELLNVRYDMPLTKEFYAFSKALWLYSADSRDIGLNRYERLNGLFGVKYDFYKNSSVEAAAGAEKNTQVGINSSGPSVSIKGNLSDYNIFDNTFNAGIIADYSAFQNNRINSGTDNYFSVGRMYDSLSFYKIGARYKILNGDYFNPPAIGTPPPLSFENRNEQRIGVDFNLGYRLIDDFSSNIVFSFANTNVGRSYKNVFDDLPITKILRYVNETQTFLSAELKYNSRILFQSVMMAYGTRDESDGIDILKPISSEDETALSEAETYKDNASTRTNLLAKTIWSPDAKDRIFYDFNVYIDRFDTPDKTNYDDRDEFFFASNLSYNRIMTEAMSVYLTAGVQLKHRVYLKSERSAQNTWERIVRLNPGILLNYSGFKMNPQFEVLANYTIYDYETSTIYVKSFSLRQIGYKDSISISLPDNMSLESRLIFRYYLKGMMFWNDFSEIPQNSNFEQFSKLLLFVKPGDAISLGFGGRIYNIIQTNLTNNASKNGFQNYRLTSFGPETVVRFDFKSGNSLLFQGWYEFQSVRGSKMREIPNFYLTSIIRI